MTAVRPLVAGFEVGRHLALAGRTLAHLVFGFGLGLVALVLAAGGLVLAPLWLAPRQRERAVRLVWRLAETERRQANRLLAAHLPPLAGGRGAPLRRAVAMLLLRLALSLLGLAVAGAIALLAGFMLALAVDGLGGQDGRLLGPWELGPVLGVALLPLTGAAVVVGIAVLEGMGRLERVVVRAFLRPRTPPVGPVRELLAERLGDRTLAVAYWLPDRGIFVDERGREVELPDPATGRAWTAVERDGRRVAAIVHDAELDASPELVDAAAAAAALAIDNERLKADLRARVEDLRSSRARIVEAADEARRRLERDLHDGAQQRLVSLALDIRLLRARAPDDETAAHLEELGHKLADALAELRELARGIHPAVLSDRGLGPALEALAGRARTPVVCDVAIDGRLPRTLEAAAYFVVAEGVTNVDKYAGASAARVHVRCEGGEVVIVVADDGVGGAVVGAGTGLRGIADRLAALDGTLTVDSPPGEGTILEARIPLAEEEPR